MKLENLIWARQTETLSGLINFSWMIIIFRLSKLGNDE